MRASAQRGAVLHGTGSAVQRAGIMEGIMVDGWMDESERAEFEHWLEQVQGQARFAVVGPPDDAEPWIWGWCATVEQARRLYGEHVRVVDTVTGELVRFGSADLYGNRLRFAVQTLEVL